MKHEVLIEQPFYGENYINIGKKFYHKLLNRNQLQGDGKYNAIEFRLKFLREAEAKEWWGNPEAFYVLDFKEVEVIGPSWANEVFAYYVNEDRDIDFILRKLRPTNTTKVKDKIIKRELMSGYKG